MTSDGYWARFKNATASFIELLATGVAPEPPVALGGPLRPLRNLLRAARDAPNFPIPHPGRSYASRVSTSQSVLARRITEPLEAIAA